MMRLEMLRQSICTEIFRSIDISLLPAIAFVEQDLVKEHLEEIPKI